MAPELTIQLLESNVGVRYFEKHNKRRLFVCLEGEEFTFVINLNE